MCHDRPFVVRPSCSSTRHHSTCDQPWPPCSTACRPPCRRASIAARRMTSTAAAVRAGVARGGGDATAPAGRRAPPAPLGHLLARDQDVLDEPPRALLQLA